MDSHPVFGGVRVCNRLFSCLHCVFVLLFFALWFVISVFCVSCSSIFFYCTFDFLIHLSIQNTNAGRKRVRVRYGLKIIRCSIKNTWGLIIMQCEPLTSNVGTNICQKRQHIFLRNKDPSFHFAKKYILIL